MGEKKHNLKHIIIPHKVHRMITSNKTYIYDVFYRSSLSSFLLQLKYTFTIFLFFIFVFKCFCLNKEKIVSNMTSQEALEKHKCLWTEIRRETQIIKLNYLMMSSWFTRTADSAKSELERRKGIYYYYAESDSWHE